MRYFKLLLFLCTCSAFPYTCSVFFTLVQYFRTLVQRVCMTTGSSYADGDGDGGAADDDGGGICSNSKVS